VRWIWPWQDRNRQFSWLKASAFALVLLPAVRTAWLIGIGDYGTVAAIIFNGLTYWSGVWATVVLLAALAVTPAAVILRWPALADVRRMVGVAGLVYSLAHMIIYFQFRNWDWAFIGNDMLRTSMVVAALSTAGLIALGATSLDAAIKYMGARNWNRLHTANYAITGLAILHVVLARGTYAEQYMLAGIFFWLMAWRVLARYKLGANATALVLLAAGSGLFAALLEAGFLWMRRGFDAVTTLALNLSLAILDVGYPPAWQVLAFGVAVLLAFAGRAVFRWGKTVSIGARRVA
jgi:sulfoxide reductase heme-binding subunit YedZ